MPTYKNFSLLEGNLSQMAFMVNQVKKFLDVFSVRIHPISSNLLKHNVTFQLSAEMGLNGECSKIFKKLEES